MNYLFWTLCLVVAGPSVDPPQMQAKAADLGIPYDRYFVRDRLGRTITFYLSTRSGAGPRAKQPVLLFIAGSGCQSLFQRIGERVGGGYQNLMLAHAGARVRILVVEKPGVKYLDAPAQPGSALGASQQFLSEHTLPRWAEANIAALRGVWTMPEIDRSLTLVVGHSEGGSVAAKVAAELPEVTHVASLAGGGPTQLFDFVANASRVGPDDKPGDASRRIRDLYAEWTKIQNDPESISQFWLGHPYRRWSSFLKYSVLEGLTHTKARIYLAHGTRDTVIPVASHDMLVSELKVRGHDVTSERLEGADHGFQTEEMPVGPPVGMQAISGRVLKWFLEKRL
jgi:pimeloyl-ACP methyl ester carboxylesterase